MPDSSLDAFYAALAAQAGTTTAALRPADEHLVPGHFNIFDVAEVLRHPPPPAVPSLKLDRPTYYKISATHAKRYHHDPDCRARSTGGPAATAPNGLVAGRTGR